MPFKSLYEDILKAPKGYHQVFAEVLKTVLKLNDIGLVVSKSQTVWAAHSKGRSWKMSLRLGEERREGAFQEAREPLLIRFPEEVGRALCSSVLLRVSGDVPIVGATMVFWA